MKLGTNMEEGKSAVKAILTETRNSLAPPKRKYIFNILCYIAIQSSLNVLQHNLRAFLHYITFKLQL